VVLLRSSRATGDFVGDLLLSLVGYFAIAMPFLIDPAVSLVDYSIKSADYFLAFAISPSASIMFSW